jgi:hypothetical protein
MRKSFHDGHLQNGHYHRLTATLLDAMRKIPAQRDPDLWSFMCRALFLSKLINQEEMIELVQYEAAADQNAAEEESVIEEFDSFEEDRDDPDDVQLENLEEENSIEELSSFDENLNDEDEVQLENSTDFDAETGESETEHVGDIFVDAVLVPPESGAAEEYKADKMLEAEKYKADKMLEAEQHKAEAEKHKAEAEKHRAEAEKHKAEAEKYKIDKEFKIHELTQISIRSKEATKQKELEALEALLKAIAVLPKEEGKILARRYLANLTLMDASSPSSPA